MVMSCRTWLYLPADSQEVVPCFISLLFCGPQPAVSIVENVALNLSSSLWPSDMWDNCLNLFKTENKGFHFCPHSLLVFCLVISPEFLFPLHPGGQPIALCRRQMSRNRIIKYLPSLLIPSNFAKWFFPGYGENSSKMRQGIFSFKNLQWPWNNFSFHQVLSSIDGA